MPSFVFAAHCLVLATSLMPAPLPSRPHAGAGDLDLSFGQGGRVLTDVALPGYSDFRPVVESVLVQPDRKILVCGRFWNDGPSYWFGTFLVRYLPDGSLDPSFGEDGKVIVLDLAPGGSWTVGADMVLQPDGKIVLIGQYTIAAGILVQRYTAQGTLDPTFGDHGQAVVPAGMEGTSIALQPDGKIVGVGWEFAWNPSYVDAIVVFRLNQDGSTDATFGSAGSGVTKITHGYDGGKVLVQPDGAILVVGTLFNHAAGMPPTPFLARYNPDGSPDASFGTSGMVTHRVDDVDSSHSGAAQQPDGKIVVVGRAPSIHRSFVARYNPDGSSDTTFGTDGVFSVQSSVFTSPSAVLLHPGGKVIATGNAFDPASGGNGFVAMRLTSSGSLDPTFGANGRSLLSVPNDGATGYAFASAGAIQHAGEILMGGYVFGTETTALIRLGRAVVHRPAAADGRLRWSSAGVDQ